MVLNPFNAGVIIAIGEDDPNAYYGTILVRNQSLKVDEGYISGILPYNMIPGSVVIDIYDTKTDDVILLLNITFDGAPLQPQLSGPLFNLIKANGGMITMTGGLTRGLLDKAWFIKLNILGLPEAIARISYEHSRFGE